MKFILSFFFVFFFTGSVWYPLHTRIQELEIALSEAHGSLLSCASNGSFSLLLDSEVVSVDCVRFPSWRDFSVADRKILKRTQQWLVERDRTLERLRYSKPPQVGRLDVSRTIKSQ